MKRTISILVIVAMMLATVLAIVPASAATPEGTAISNVAEFAAMDPAGVYYLANDLTLSATYESANFAGTLDGNGKTITLSGVASAFKELEGATIRNLTLAVDYEFTSSVAAGSLARYASGNFTNITANVNYKYGQIGKATKPVGALFAEINGASTLINCVTATMLVTTVWQV